MPYAPIKVRVRAGTVQLQCPMCAYWWDATGANWANGVTTMCRHCFNELARIRQRGYDADCREAKSLKGKLRYAANRDRYMEANRRYKADPDNRARMAVTMRAYRESHREELAEKNRAYREANRERLNAYQRERYARMKAEKNG